MLMSPLNTLVPEHNILIFQMYFFKIEIFWLKFYFSLFLKIY